MISKNAKEYTYKSQVDYIGTVIFARRGYTGLLASTLILVALVLGCGGFTEVEIDARTIVTAKLMDEATVKTVFAPNLTPKATSLSTPLSTPTLTTIVHDPTPVAPEFITTGQTTEHERDQTWSFTVKQGTFVKIIGAPAEGSNIKVALELFGPDGSTLHINIDEGGLMPSTGEYLLVVTGANDTTGDYFLEFTGLLKKDVQLRTNDVPQTRYMAKSMGASKINLNFDCNRPYYDSQPIPVSSDSVHRYYEYYWQPNPKLCINVYEPDLIDDYWEDRISKILTFSIDTLGLVVPVNVTVLDQRNSTPETLQQVNIDECSLRQAHYVNQEQLDECVKHADPWGNRFASSGVDGESLLNGGHMALFAGNWEGYEGNEDQEDQTTKIFMHEYFHIHQNALKFFFESTRTFGIPISWQDDPNNNIHEEPPTQPWVFPNWIEEGGAEFAGMILAAKFDPSFDARFLFEQTLDEARNVVLTAANNGDMVSLKDYEYQGGVYESSDNPNNGIAREYAYQYSGGAWAFMYLWSLEENNLQKIMVDYYKQWAEKENASPGNAWKDSFESLFGITLDDFYKGFDTFMLQSKESQMAILKTKDEIRVAALAP